MAAISAVLIAATGAIIATNGALECSGNGGGNNCGMRRHPSDNAGDGGGRIGIGYNCYGGRVCGGGRRGGGAVVGGGVGNGAVISGGGGGAMVGGGVGNGSLRGVMVGVVVGMVIGVVDGVVVVLGVAA